MKFPKLLKPLPALFLLFLILSGCQKEDWTTGTLEVTFFNHPADLTVIISPVENPDIVITDQLKPDDNGKLTCNLNYGNYILKPWSTSTYFSNIGFQIRAGETTVVVYGADNDGHVQ